MLPARAHVAEAKAAVKLDTRPDIVPSLRLAHLVASHVLPLGDVGIEEVFGFLSMCWYTASVV